MFWGYLAIDNFITAGLLAAGESPGKSHPAKVKKFLKRFPSAAGDVKGAEHLLDYCDLWNDVRYERANVSRTDAQRLLDTSWSVRDYCLARVADLLGLASEAIEAEVDEVNREARVLEPAFPEDVYRYFDIVQQDLEAYAESTGQSRLSAKFGTVWNDITIPFFSDRDWARSLIETDGEIADRLITMYEAFVRVNDMIVRKREAQLAEASESSEGVGVAPWDFSFVAVFRYRGLDTMQEWSSEEFLEQLRKAVEEARQRFRSEQSP